MEGYNELIPIFGNNNNKGHNELPKGSPSKIFKSGRSGVRNTVANTAVIATNDLPFLYYNEIN